MTEIHNFLFNEEYNNDILQCESHMYNAELSIFEAQKLFKTN